MENILWLVSAGSLFILLIYWVTIMIQILGYKPNPKQSNAVSVIVCAHNEYRNLLKLIPKLQSQKHSDFEIIIVDDRSDDETYDYLLEHQSEQLRFVRVDKVHDHINAKKYALTLGIKAAKHDIVLLTDADCIPNSDQWITEMTGEFDKNTTYVLGASPYYAAKSLLGHFISFETQWTAINYLGFGLAGNPYMAVGRNLAYRKSAFLAHKGFSKVQHITGGDDDLLINEYATGKNTRVAIGERALTFSIPETNWGDYFAQKRRHLSVSKYYRFKDKFLLGLQNLSNLVFWLALTILAIQTNNYLIPAGMLFFRMVFMTILIHTTSKKIGYRMNIWLVPLMDILYVFYASIFGIIALLTKKVKWKK